MTTKVEYYRATNTRASTAWLIRVVDGQDPVDAFQKLAPLLDRLDNKDLKR